MSAVFIQGNQVYLRALSQDDATPAYLSWINDPETTRGLVTGHFPSNLQSLKDYINSVTGNRDKVMLAICDLNTGQHIGNIKLDQFDWISGTCELGILIGSVEHRGKGIGAEVCSLVVSYAFERLNLRKILLAVYASNPGAIRAYEKAGFAEEARLREHVYSAGSYTDKIYMSVFRN
ncbi:MAG: GNAT family N-acetyltransferase [Flavobacteriales bacterium]|jgi:RimJ/RimL family protein N-acetyltransferase